MSVLIGLFLLLLSIAVAFWTATRIAVEISEGFDQFWIAVLVGYLQISLITLLISVPRVLGREWFLLCQGGFAIIVYATTNTEIKGRIGRFLETSAEKLADSNNFIQLYVVTVVVLCAFTLLARLYFPLKGDGMRYIAPRVLYWLQQGYVGPYETLDQMQLSVAFGTDYLFLWGTMFTKTEIVARVLYWLAVPLSIVGVYSLLDTFELRDETKFLGLVLYSTIPIVHEFAGYQLQPLLWVILFSVGAGYWVRKEPTIRSTVFLALFVALAASSKDYALALMSGGFVVSAFRTINDRRSLSVVVYLMSFFVGIAATGYMFLYLKNLLVYGSLFNQEVASWAIGGIGIYPFYVKFVRFLFLLAEFPIPIESIRQPVESTANYLLDQMGAKSQLDYSYVEDLHGDYTVTIQPVPREGFGLLGIFVLLSMPLLLRSARQKLRVDTLANIFRHDTVQYGILVSSLVFGPLTLLRFTNIGYSIESWMAPGVVLLLPVPLYFVEKSDLKLRLVVTVLVLSYSLLFVAYTGHNVYSNTQRLNQAPGFSPTGISYSSANDTGLCVHPIIRQNVPADATLLLLMRTGGHVKTYPLFGTNYRRELVPVVTAVTNSTLRSYSIQYQNAYVYVTEEYFSESGTNQSVVRRSPNTEFIQSGRMICGDNQRTWLYKLTNNKSSRRSLFDDFD